jgi:hypothetical protein
VAGLQDGAARHQRAHLRSQRACGG